MYCSNREKSFSISKHTYVTGWALNPQETWENALKKAKTGK
jgi:hypothetical protein